MLETKKVELNRAANAVRQALGASVIAQARGFKGDLFDILVARNESLAEVMLRLEPVPLKVLQDLNHVSDLMDATANAAINDESWPSALEPGSSVGIAALEHAHTELRRWDKAPFEGRMQSIFKYLGDDSGYDEWCAAFASWCLAKVPSATWASAGVKLQTNKGVLNLLRAFQDDASTKHLVKKSYSTAPRPGDIVFWDRADEDGNLDSGYGHIGFVFSVNGDRVKTLEGNSSMSVTLNEYKKKFVKSSKHRFRTILRLP